MESNHSGAFDVIPFDDIKGNWKKLGSGSFGNVYKGSYLGIDVAIKEVMPSTEYDVAKYFEREWRLMKESRHPNVVLYLGLSRAPDGRIYIISEFIENGNLRTYIYDKNKPFPWRLRLSFATDIARALAYLHARRCIHRDLKGENLLVTANGRLKITDFGFARIAARNAEESKRLTFCGTDSYMSPEILIGNEFDLPTDIFSLGVIFCEIAARKLADDHTFKRTPPSFGIDEAEVRRLASPDCPPAFIQLAMECLREQPSERPKTVDVLARLREIEAEVLARPTEGEDAHVGSVKFMTGHHKRHAAKRIPSFGMGVGKDIRESKMKDEGMLPLDDDDSDDDSELLEAVNGLGTIKLEGDSGRGLLNNSSIATGVTHSAGASDVTDSDYSTTVIRAHSPQTAGQPPPSLSSILTVRSPVDSPHVHPLDPSVADSDYPADYPTSMMTIESYRTAPSMVSTNLSIAAATEGGSTITKSAYHAFKREAALDSPTLPPSPPAEPEHEHPDVAPSVLAGGSPSAAEAAGSSDISVGPALLHRFTLIKPGAKRVNGLTSPSKANFVSPSSSSFEPGWSPLDFFFSSGLLSLSGKCDICSKRLGWKPVLECDDCGLRCHIKCGELAPLDCGIRAARLSMAHAHAHAGSSGGATGAALKKGTSPR